MSKFLRPLVSLVPQPNTNSIAINPPSGGGKPSPPLPPKPKNTLIACESCRLRKVKCNGVRPACLQCTSRGKASDCHYQTNPSETHRQATKRKLDAAQEANSTYHDFVDMLRSRPLHDVTEIVNRLRAGTSPEDLVRHVRSGDLLLQMHLTPETQYQHSMGNFLIIPDFFKAPDNPYMASLVFEKRFSPPPAPKFNILPADQSAMYDAPYHTAQVIDPVIDDAVPSKWTNVLAEDEVLRDILRAYFLCVHVSLPFFHKDYFLHDLAKGRSRFCSSLLVNSVLAAGCRAYNRLPNRSHFWNPSLLQYKFHAEARRLRELEAGKRNITRIQADLVLHMINGMDGQDMLGVSLCYQAICTAHEMHLFEPQSQLLSDAWKTVRTTTVWALFAWQSTQSYHHGKPPLITIPPDQELPSEPNAFGEMWIKYPLADAPVPVRLSDIFRAIAEFRVIMNDINSSVGSPQPIQLPQAMAHLSRLHEWYRRLPLHLGPQRLIIPAHFHVHMHYWLVVAQLFEPLQGHESENVQQSISTTPSDSPRAIVLHAKTCFRTLLRLYYSSHGNEGYDVFALLIAQYTGFSALGNIAAPVSSVSPAVREAYESDIMISAEILYGQSHIMYLGGMLLRVMYASLPPTLATRVSRFLTIKDVDEETAASIAQQAHSLWPMVVVAPQASKDDRRLGNLFRAISLADGDGLAGEREDSSEPPVFYRDPS